MKTTVHTGTHKPHHGPTIIVVAATAALTLILLMVNVLFSPTLPGTEASTVGTVNPIADAYVNSGSGNTNFGTRERLEVDNASGRIRVAYLMFDLSPYAGKTLSKAVLRVKTLSVEEAGSAQKQTINIVNNTTWKETAITYNSRPTISNTVVGSVINTRPGTVYDIPLSLSELRNSFVSGTKLSLAILPTGSNNVFFHSREGAVKPQLILTYDNPVASPTKPPTPTPTRRPSPTPTITVAPTTVPPTPTCYPPPPCVTLPGIGYACPLPSPSPGVQYCPISITPSPTNTPTPSAYPLSVSTDRVSLNADDFYIEENGQIYRPNETLISKSDPGNATYTTLELTWRTLTPENSASERKLNIYFASDGANWWATEIRTYNSLTGLWIHYKNNYFSTPLGTAFVNTGEEHIVGGISTTNQPDNGRIYFRNIKLQAFTSASPPPVCPLKSSGDANCDNKVDMIDFEMWREEFLGSPTVTIAAKKADFNNDTHVDLVDFESWRQGFVARLLP